MVESRNLPAAASSGEQRQASDADRAEPCPAPLAWQQVLDRFRKESQPWTIERDSRVLQGRTWGEGVPLYFLNGFGGTLELFAPSIWLLRDEFRCIAFDYAVPAHNSSSFKRQTVSDLSADLYAVADSHGDVRFSVYATSFGSLVALSAMLEQPERIERAVIQNGFAHRKLTICEKALITLSCHLPGKLSHVPLRQQIQQQNHRPWFPPFDPTRFDFFLQNTGSVLISELAARASSLKRLDLRQGLAEIENEVLLIRTEGEGRVAAQCMQGLQDALKNALTERLHTCGQLPFLTHPHRLVTFVKQFLLEEQQAVAE